jgi:hypothetical protein
VLAHSGESARWTATMGCGAEGRGERRQRLLWKRRGGDGRQRGTLGARLVDDSTAFELIPYSIFATEEPDGTFIGTTRASSCRERKSTFGRLGSLEASGSHG